MSSSLKGEVESSRAALLYFCMQCPTLEFRDVEDARAHVIRAHLGAPKFTCPDDECDKEVRKNAAVEIWLAATARVVVRAYLGLQGQHFVFNPNFDSVRSGWDLIDLTFRSLPHESVLRRILGPTFDGAPSTQTFARKTVLTFFRIPPPQDILPFPAQLRHPIDVRGTS